MGAAILFFSLAACLFVVIHKGIGAIGGDQIPQGFETRDITPLIHFYGYVAAGVVLVIIIKFIIENKEVSKQVGLLVLTPIWWVGGRIFFALKIIANLLFGWFLMHDRGLDPSDPDNWRDFLHKYGKFQDLNPELQELVLALYRIEGQIEIDREAAKLKKEIAKRLSQKARADKKTEARVQELLKDYIKINTPKAKTQPARKRVPEEYELEVVHQEPEKEQQADPRTISELLEDIVVILEKEV